MGSRIPAPVRTLLVARIDITDSGRPFGDGHQGGVRGAGAFRTRRDREGSEAPLVWERSWASGPRAPGHSRRWPARPVCARQQRELTVAHVRHSSCLQPRGSAACHPPGHGRSSDRQEIRGRPADAWLSSGAETCRTGPTGSWRGEDPPGHIGRPRPGGESVAKPTPEESTPKGETLSCASPSSAPRSSAQRLS